MACCIRTESAVVTSDTGNCQDVSWDTRPSHVHNYGDESKGFNNMMRKEYQGLPKHMKMRDSVKMNRDLFLSDLALPDVIVAPRTDPIYNAHGYLTKVPVDAITPYISAFTKPGEVVVDMFAGSGMTAVAARITGRSAVVSDISELGRHIGRGY